MADVKTCDLCGKVPANRVEIGIVLWSIVVLDRPTATSEVLDACPECQVPAIDALVAHAKETLHEQAPMQVEMLKAAAERDAAQEQFNREVKPSLELIAQAGGTTIPVELATRRDEVLKLVERAEERRLAIFDRAGQMHDTRIAAFRQSVKR